MYITTIYRQKKEISENEKIIRFRKAIREIPLPKPTTSSTKEITVKVKVQDDFGNEVEIDQTETVTSDIEEPVEMDKPGSWPKGWLPNKDEREVGQYLLKVVEASICQDAKDVATAMGNPKDRNGFMAIERLADVFGRNASHISMMPQLFTWGTGVNLASDWNNYKTMLDSSQYAKLHPGKPTNNDLVGYVWVYSLSTLS